MAKKLIYNYTFTPGSSGVGNVKFSGSYTQRNLVLITNVTDGTIVYNFADSASVSSSASYDSANDETTVTFVKDTSSMSSSDELQILVDDGQDTKIDAGESLIDPVHKFRVSTPENLIDTDFEYGLQPTKWETIELVDNIPSVYTRSSGVSIGGISQANSTQNSDIIRVACTVDHDLSLGDPIEVQGLKSRTANGKYIVTAVPSVREFTYRASSVQSTTQNQVTAYTTIIPGSFFSGSDIKYDKIRGIETDNASPSTLTFETDYTHGLSTSTSLYFTNTVGKQNFTISNTTATAPDGSSTIDTSNESIYVDGNNFYENQEIFISPGGGGALPSLQAGSPEPTSASLCNSAFEAAQTACDSIVSSMTFHEYFLQSYLYGNNYAFYSDGNYLNFNGKQGSFIRQYIRMGDWDSTDYLYVGTPSNQSQTGWRCNNQSLTNEFLYTGSPVDLGSRFVYWYGPGNLVNTLEGKLWFQSTAFEHNTFSDYILQVRQLGNLNEIVTNGDRAYYQRNSTVTKRPSTSAYRNYDLVASNNIQTSLGNGWYYSWHGTQHRGRWSTTYPGWIGITIRLENTAWPTDRATDSSNWFNVFTSSYYSLDSYSGTYSNGSRYEIFALFPYYPSSFGNNGYYGQFGTELTFAQMAQTIATEVANSLGYESSWYNSSGINTVRVVPSTSGRITLKSLTNKPYAFSSTGTGPINIETGQVSGAVDNYYNISSVTSTTASIDVTSQIPPRTLEFDNSDVILFDGEYYIFYDVADGHGMSDGSEVTFNVTSGTAPGGLSNGTTYYAIVDDAKHFRLATTSLNASGGVSAITSAGSGTFNIQIFTISGRSSATGTVEAAENSQIVSGSGTKFTSTYKIGDTFSIVSAGSTVNSFIENTVISIVNDTSLTLATPAGVTTTGAPHYVDTKINVRADGEFLHRPFDGGVDITAGTSPDSTIVRQTRKYFRYQSGKGIQCSMAINFNPARPIRSASGSGTSVVMTTEYPHGLTTGDSVRISGSDDAAYNGTFSVTSATDFTFSYTALSSVSDADPSGFIDYAIQGYSNAGIRAGLFDFQNGFFFEYDGQDLYAVRRSSVQQLAGTVTVVYNSNKIFGANTKFGNQISADDRIVVRGQTYKVTAVVSDTELHIQPSYRGVSTNGVIVTKTVDTKVAQSNWNIDKADGTGPSRFNLDINKIQMVYLDYSWYGAGKIRFGFKDTYGHVKYMHEFIHNNRLNEAYMRSGNIPARYEVFNKGIPTYVPSLFHWGTSVIMDGGFDDDDSYLFTASGNTLTFTNGDADTATTSSSSSLYSTGRRFRDYYVRIPFATSDASKFATGIPLYTSGGELGGEAVAFTSYGSGVFYVYVYVSSGYSAPASYPIISSGTTVNIGAETVGTTNVDLNSDIPLISIRLAPSADNNLIGALGARDVVNRMQLKMQELGISISHDAEIKVILNGSLSNLNYENVGTPSLSQFVAHKAGDTVNDGITIYKFRASGGSTDSTGKRLNASNAFDLSQLIDLGNSILGGDDVFPNGPDIVTITASVINTAEIDSTSAFQVASRLSWAESQA